MSRQARIISETGYYHIIMRGNNKSYIFEQKEAKAYFMNALRKVEGDELLSVAAWCIMDNHVHLVIKSEPDDLAIAFKRINIKFAMYCNKKYKTVGHVFQDRFKSEVVESDESLLNVIRYVHNNPVKAKMVDKPKEYEWSSYNAYTSNKIEAGMTFSWKLFGQKAQLFISFHQIEDDREYLEIKEDQLIFRQNRAQSIIQSICNEKGIIESKEIYRDQLLLKEIADRLVDESGMSGCQIARLMGISESRFRRVRGKK